MVELLAPAGDLERLKIAIQYGADAVYIGGNQFSLRKSADNFSNQDIKIALDYCKSKNKKLYVACNIVTRNSDVDKILEFGYFLQETGVDAVILSDLGLVSLFKKNIPNLDVHISTQANSTNYATCEAWRDLGVKRIVLARELNLKEIQEIKSKLDGSVELEVFVHGAMCMAHSGRCLLSSYLTNRHANHGDCAHPCRWNYKIRNLKADLIEETRPEQIMSISENEQGSFIFNSKDLCMISHLKELIESCISSLKIEGRMKSEYYIATVVKAYRQEIDRYYENPEEYIFNGRNLEELKKVSHRQYSTGFFFGNPLDQGQVYETNSYIRDYSYIGRVIEHDLENKILIVQQKNKFCVGDVVEIMTPTGVISIDVTKILDEKNQEIGSAPHAQMITKIPINNIDNNIPTNSILRLKL